MERVAPLKGCTHIKGFCSILSAFQGVCISESHCICILSAFQGVHIEVFHCVEVSAFQGYSARTSQPSHFQPGWRLCLLIQPQNEMVSILACHQIAVIRVTQVIPFPGLCHFLYTNVGLGFMHVGVGLEYLGLTGLCLKLSHNTVMQIIVFFFFFTVHWPVRWGQLASQRVPKFRTIGLNVIV